MQTAHRRRRKRARVQTDQRSAIQNFEDDSQSAFLDLEGDALSDREAVRACLPALLEERRLGLKNQRKITIWQTQALFTFTKKPENKKQYRRQWRPFAKRRIPFTKLGTPISDAVLALERKGSYVLSLGSRQTDSNVPLSLAIRLYGVPSPYGISARESGLAGTTPLLSVIPLLYENVVEESAEDTIFNFRGDVSPASTPVKLLISNDWNIGCAMIEPSNVWREEGPVGTLVLFSLPRNNPRSNETKVYRCINVPIAGMSSFTMRNLLWRVEGIPQKTRDTAKDIFHSILQLPGYLLFNDEGDGFRMTWVLHQWNRLEANCRRELPSSYLVVGNGPSIISIQETWEESYSDTRDGSRILHDENADSFGIIVASEAFLHVDVLLRNILFSRKPWSDDHPEFFYNLISVTERGQVAELVITFLRKGKLGSLGVFVKVDLYTGGFQELDWVKSLSVSDAPSLKEWCNILSFNRRMRHMRAGPFSAGTQKLSMDWSGLCQESFFDLDQEDDYSPSYWTDYLSDTKAVSTRRPPKFISLASLYPDCDFVSNEAITSCLPVSSLECKNSPIQLVYG